MYHIVRVSLAITFIWIGVLIFKEPEFWGSMIQPWAMNFLLVPLREAMMGTAVLDIIIGFLLLIDFLPWLAALLGSIHLVIVLTTTGITATTVRDIGLLGASIAVMVSTWPKKK